MKQFVSKFSLFSKIYEQVLSEKEELKGGLADKRTLQDIADHHGVPLSEIEKQYNIGIKVEREHTENDEKAAEITKDHIWEIKDYYTKLKKVEK